MSHLNKNMRIGLLGGSFNPAHEGHLHISNLAMKHLKLDKIWWLVSPQNPLKSQVGMASFDVRVRAARKVVGDNSEIVVSDIEKRLLTFYAVDTIVALKREFPGTSFVWIIGSDLLVQLPYWKKWRHLFKTVPVAIFARPSYSSRALSGRVIRRFAASRISRFRIGSLAEMSPPAWSYVRTRLNRQSSSRIRAQN